MTKTRPYPITPRYASLPLISLLVKLMGFLVLGFGVAVFCYGLYAMVIRGSVQALGVFLLELFASLILAILLIALSNVIQVLMDIEENTRRLADHTTGAITGTTPRQETGEQE